MKEDKLLKHKDEISKLYTIEKYSIKKISLIYNVSKSTIHDRLIKWNVIDYIPKESKLDNYKEEIIDLYFNKKYSTIKIAKIYNTTSSLIHRYLNNHNLKTRTNSESNKTYFANDSFFKIIDNEINAYWLGFLFADGYLCNRDNLIGVSLGIKDLKHLEKFQKHLNTTYPIHQYVETSGYGKGKKYCRLQITSREINNSCLKTRV